jgi:hypothetical protein
VRGLNGRITVKARPGINLRPYSKITKAKRIGGMGQKTTHTKNTVLAGHGGVSL